MKYYPGFLKKKRSVSGLLCDQERRLQTTTTCSLAAASHSRFWHFLLIAINPHLPLQRILSCNNSSSCKGIAEGQEEGLGFGCDAHLLEAVGKKNATCESSTTPSSP